MDAVVAFGDAGQQELASDQAVRESVCIEEIAGLSR
jgi:hypothetical protein